MERRFQPITVDEPNVEDTIEILKVLETDEAHHRLNIRRSTGSRSKLSSRYITDGFYRIRRLTYDEAASRVRLKTMTTPPELRNGR